MVSSSTTKIFLHVSFILLCFYSSLNASSSPTSTPTESFVISDPGDLFTSVTSIPCNNTKDCLDAYTKEDWCKRGVFCLKSYCHLLNGSFPCKNHEICNRTLQKCLPRNCQIDSDCDDGKYCNGRERCDKRNGTCLESLHPIECHGGECNETIRECSFVPKIIHKWEGFKETGTVSNNNNDNNIKGSVQSPNKPLLVYTPPPPPPNDSPDIIGKETHNDQFQSNHHTNTSSAILFAGVESTLIIAVILFMFGLSFAVILLGVFFGGGGVTKIVNHYRSDSENESE